MTRRILLVDDEAHAREIVTLALEVVAGWTVMSAASGPEGVGAARRERPDVILLDIMMPDMDGIDMLSKLTADDATADIPVILLTAKALPSDRRRFEQLGLAGTISKPFDPVDLATQIAAIMGWPL